MTTELKAREAPARYVVDFPRVRPGDKCPKGYKQTEVGVIPEDWDAGELGDYVQKVGSGITPTGGERVYKKEGRTFLRSQNVGWGNLILDDVAFIDDALHETFQSTEIVVGDVFLNITGASIGRSAVADVHVSGGNVNQHVCIIRTNKEQLHPYFLNYFLLSESGQRQIDSFQAGGNRQGLNFGQIRSFQLVVPPLPEQRAIATALSDVDALLAKFDQLIAKKRDLKQAAMQQLITGSTRLPGFSGVWEVKTIEELEKIGFVKLSRGKVISKKDIERHPGDCPIYSSSVKNDGLFGCYGEHMFDEELITWSVDGGGHFFHRAKHKFSVTNVCGFMRVDTSKLGYRFLAAQLQLLHSNLKFDYQDKAHPSVIRKAYSVCIPDLEEQTAIATILSDMDTELAALEARRAKTRDLKQGMMQELLTGRIRLV